MHAPRPAWATPAMLTVVVIWAFNFIAMRLVLAEVPLLVTGALRFLLAGILLLAVLKVVEGSIAVPRELWGQLFFLGLLGNSLYQVLFMVALQRTTVGNTAILLATSPLQTALLGAALGVEKPSGRLITALVLALAGAGLVLSDRGFSLDLETFLGDLAALGAAFCWASFTLGVRKLPGELSPLRVTALTTIAGAPVLLLVSAPQFLSLEWTAVTWKAWSALGYSVTLSIGLAYLLWNASVAAVGVNRTAIFNCLTPLVAMLMAWPILHEVPGTTQWAGGTLIVAAVILGRWSPASLLRRAAA
jgi:drug/metabolite transporter (DMT)-like permease